MKKVLLSASLIAGTFMASFAQTSAGAIAIGGTIGIATSGGKHKTTANGTTTTNDNPKSTSIRFVPNVSYFLSDKFALGLGVGYTNSTSVRKEYNPDYQLKSSGPAIIVNPYAKYYIGLGEKTYFLLQGDLSLVFGKQKSQEWNGTAVVDKDPTNSTVIGIGVLPGILFFPSEKIGIEFTLGTQANLVNGGGAYLLGFSSQVDKTKGAGNTETKDITNTFSFLNLNTIGVGVSAFYFIK